MAPAESLTRVPTMAIFGESWRDVVAIGNSPVKDWNKSRPGHKLNSILFTLFTINPIEYFTDKSLCGWVLYDISPWQCFRILSCRSRLGSSPSLSHRRTLTAWRPRFPVWKNKNVEWIPTFSKNLHFSANPLLSIRRKIVQREPAVNVLSRKSVRRPLQLESRTLMPQWKKEGNFTDLEDLKILTSRIRGICLMVRYYQKSLTNLV